MFEQLLTLFGGHLEYALSNVKYYHTFQKSLSATLYHPIPLLIYYYPNFHASKSMQLTIIKSQHYYQRQFFADFQFLVGRIYKVPPLLNQATESLQL